MADGAGRLPEGPFDKGVAWRFTGTAAPVQAEGDIDGVPFYFRSRGHEWTFGAADGAQPDPVLIESEWDGFFRREIYRGASRMPLDVAKAIIERCIEQYRQAVTQTKRLNQ